MARPGRHLCGAAGQLRMVVRGGAGSKPGRRVRTAVSSGCVTLRAATICSRISDDPSVDSRGAVQSKSQTSCSLASCSQAGQGSSCASATAEAAMSNDIRAPVASCIITPPRSASERQSETRRSQRRMAQIYERTGRLSTVLGGKSLTSPSTCGSSPTPRQPWNVVPAVVVCPGTQQRSKTCKFRTS